MGFTSLLVGFAGSWSLPVVFTGYWCVSADSWRFPEFLMVFTGS